MGACGCVFNFPWTEIHNVIDTIALQVTGTGIKGARAGGGLEAVIFISLAPERGNAYGIREF